MSHTAANARPDDPEGGKPIPENFTGNTPRASWQFSLPDIRANIAHCTHEGKEALVSAFLWCTDHHHPVHRNEFARRVGYSPNVIYKIYAGKYVDPGTGKQYDVPTDLIKAIRQFIEVERERFLGGQTEFVMTPTARKIFTACDLARESQTPVFLWGPSHIGKTWALERYSADNNHGRTVYIRMKAASGLGGMVRRMAERLGVSPKANTADLIDRIKLALTPNMLVLLDELHLLMYTYRAQSFFACLEVVREIYDEVQCGLVLCGTKLLLEKMDAGKHHEMEQLMRRGVHKVPLPNMPTKADLSAILRSSGLEFPDRKDVVTVKDIDEKPYEVLRQLAKNHGLKAITERLRYSRKLAARKGDKKLAWEHFVEAHLIIAAQAAADNDGGWE